jgi:hypothetical protein
VSWLVDEVSVSYWLVSVYIYNNFSGVFKKKKILLCVVLCCGRTKEKLV